MQALRNAVCLARLVLAWFALSIGAAVASPVIKPQAVELVCSGSGAVKWLVKGDDGGKPAAGAHALDCPLCAPSAAPAVVAQGITAAVPLSGPIPRSDRAVPPQARAAAPPPARGPPAPTFL